MPYVVGHRLAVFDAGDSKKTLTCCEFGFGTKARRDAKKLSLQIISNDTLWKCAPTLLPVYSTFPVFWITYCLELLPTRICKHFNTIHQCLWNYTNNYSTYMVAYSRQHVLFRHWSFSKNLYPSIYRFWKCFRIYGLFKYQLIFLNWNVPFLLDFRSDSLWNCIAFEGQGIAITHEQTTVRIQSLQIWLLVLIYKVFFRNSCIIYFYFSIKSLAFCVGGGEMWED